ncbi:MAG: carboxymuconolactone decarboxylase family protein [Phycisphaerales bacterium]
MSEHTTDTHAAHHYETWGAQTKRITSETPAIAQGFGALFGKVMAPGALDVKQKELIALGIGMALRCEHCIYAHAEKCVKAGATREEILEVAGVVVMMQGGPGYVYTPVLLEALDALGA